MSEFIKKARILTSESVTAGHPDKVCDCISDSILDACLREDNTSRVACETLIKGNMVVLAGEITSKYTPNYTDIVKDALKHCVVTPTYIPSMIVEVISMITAQSPNIAQGVDIGGAGDQGIMFGYACKDTPSLMPAPIEYAHELCKRINGLEVETIDGSKSQLGPDGKSQVSVEYENMGRVKRIDTIVVSMQHDKNVPVENVRERVIAFIKSEELSFSGYLDKNTKYFVNPAGAFNMAGAYADAGVTGRKIIVDTYGGLAHHGGGAFSGKDPTKVDRSAAYMARLMAKYVVDIGFASRCEVQLAYAIGEQYPVSVDFNTFGTGPKNIDIALKEIWNKNKELLSVRGIITFLNLRNVSYRDLTAYGHIGANAEKLGMYWEDCTRLYSILK